MGSQFGSYFAELRRSRLGMSLRRFCDVNGYDPGNMSKLERGKLPPPQAREKLEDYARALGVARGSDEWFQFFDLAAAARGEIPRDILEDEIAVGQLPVLFRTLRGDRVDDDELDKLIEVLKRS